MIGCVGGPEAQDPGRAEEGGPATVIGRKVGQRRKNWGRSGRAETSGGVDSGAMRREARRMRTVAVHGP